MKELKEKYLDLENPNIKNRLAIAKKEGRFLCEKTSNNK